MAENAHARIAPWTARGAKGHPKLMHVLEERVDPDTGELIQVTRADKIISFLKANVDLPTACAAAGVNRSVLADWMSQASDAKAKLVARITSPPVQNTQHGGAARPNAPRLTPRERALVDFADRVDQALAETHVKAAEAITHEALGGYERVHTTEKIAVDKRGKEKVLERTTRSDTAAPNVPALQFLLRSRYPQTWVAEGETGGSGATVHVSASDLGAVVEGLADKIARRNAALAKIEAAALPEPSDDDVVDAELVADDDDG